MIALSSKAVLSGEADYRDYMRQQGQDFGKARLGDLMKKFNR